MNEPMQSQPPIFNLFWRRCAAFFYDSLLLLALYFIVTGVVVFINDGEAVRHPAYFLLLYAVGFLFFRWFWQHGGQTLGMQAWRIKLVNDKPGPLKTSQCFHRYLSGSLMFILCYLWMLKKPPGQALQDRLSKTQIVNE